MKEEKIEQLYNRRYLRRLKGKTVKLAKVECVRTSEALQKQVLTIEFMDGSRLIVKSWDTEGYVSGLDIAYQKAQK